MDRLYFAAIWLLIFIIPLENVLEIPGVGTLGRLVGLIALPVSLLSVCALKMKIRFHSLHFLTLVFVLLAGLSFYWTIDAENTIKRILTYSQILVMMWLVYQCCDTETKLMKMYQAFGLGTLILALSVISSVEHGTHGELHNFNPNDIASILSLGIPISWYVFLRARRGVISGIYLIVPLVGFIGIFLTASRGGLIKALFGLAFMILSFSTLSRWKSALILGAIGITAAVAMTWVPPEIWSRLATTQSELSSGTMGGRTGIWKMGLEIFYSHPLWGVGAGSFAYAGESLFSVFRAPHNVFLAILVDQGLIGLIVFMSIIFTVLAAVWKLPSTEKKLWLALLVIWGLSAFTSNWEWKKHTWLLFTLAAAHSTLAGHGEPMPKKEASWAFPRKMVKFRSPL